LSLSTQSAQHDDASITATPRPGTETKPAATTTEFVAYVLTVAAVLIASALVGDTDGRGDVFLADQAWFYITLLTHRSHDQPRPGQGRRRAPRRLN
jgi:hypothetical protein